MKTTQLTHLYMYKKATTLLLLLVMLGLAPAEVLAARLYSTGMEWQSVTSGVEWTTTVSTPTISTTIKNGGSASLSFSTATAVKSLQHTVASLGVYYLRYYVYVVPGAGAGANITVGLKNASNIYAGYLTITEGATPTLTVAANSTSTPIANTASLTNGNWHMIEMFANSADGAGLDDLTVRVDGTQVANANNLNLITNSVTLDVSAINTSGSGDVFYVDDIGLNDTTGSAQTSWPGTGKIVTAVPNAAGFTACTVGVFSSINEVPPSETSTGSTDRCEMTVNGGQTATFNVTDSSTLGIDSYDTINLVYTMMRLKELSSNVTIWQPLISANGSATSSGSAVDAGDLTNRTNPNGTAAFGNTLISYTNPSTAVAWTPTGTNSIDSMKIGVTGTDFNPDVYVQTMAAMVEYRDVYVPVSATSLMLGKLTFMNGKLILI